MTNLHQSAHKATLTITLCHTTNRLHTQLSTLTSWPTPQASAAKPCQNGLRPIVSNWHRWATLPTLVYFHRVPSASSASFIASRSRRAIISSPCATISSHQGKKKQGFRLVFLSLSLAYLPALFLFRIAIPTRLSPHTFSIFFQYPLQFSIATFEAFTFSIFMIHYAFRR